MAGLVSETVWQTNEGMNIPIWGMADEHLLNAVLLCESMNVKHGPLSDEVWRRGLEGELGLRRAARQVRDALLREQARIDSGDDQDDDWFVDDGDLDDGMP